MNNFQNYTWIFSLVSTALLALIAFWFKDWKTKTEKNISQNACDIKLVESALANEIKLIDKSITDFKTQMPYNYTLREDHIRSMTNLEKRLEQSNINVQQNLKEINTNVQQNLKEINTRMEQKLDDYFKTFSQKIDNMSEHLNEHILKKEG